MPEKPPVFAADDRPADIVRRYGEWLAGALGEGREYDARERAVRWRRGEQTLWVHLQGSRHNRAGEGTAAAVALAVDDERLGRWRSASPELASRPGRWLWGSLLINLTGSGRSEVELYGRLDGMSYLRPDELVPLLQDEAFPQLALLQDPQAAADAFPVQWIIEPTPFLEWALALGQPAAAKQLAVRFAEGHPLWLPAVDEARAAFARGEPRGDVHFSPTEFGRALAALGVLAAGEPLLANPPKSKRGLIRRLRGRDG